MKNGFVKSLFIACIGFLFLYWMHKKNMIDFHELIHSFFLHPKIIFLVFFLQVALCFMASIRYFTILKLFHFKVGFFNVTSSTFIGNALGQWLPGSLAFIEMIRYVLMMGATRKFNEDSVQANRKTRLMGATLFDRCLGLFVMFVFGFFSSLSIIYQGFIHGISFDRNMILILILCVLSFFALVAMILLPFLMMSAVFKKTSQNIFSFFLKFIFSQKRKDFWMRQGYRLALFLNTISFQDKKIKDFLIPLFISFVCLIFMNLSTYYCAMAAGNFIPFSAIFSTVALVSLSTLLPLGIGGVGGFQLVAAFIYSIFSVDAKTAAHAQILQNLMNLFSLTTVTLFFLKNGFSHLKELRKWNREVDVKG